MNETLLPLENPVSINLKRKLDITSSDVVLLKANVNYTEIFLLNGEKLVISKTLKELEKRFLASTQTFFRTHKSYMINLNFVKSFQPNTAMTVQLFNNETATLSRRRKDAFLEAFRKRIKKPQKAFV